MRFKIDWASLIVARKFINFQVQAPPGAYIWRGNLTEGFCVTSLGDLYLEGLIHGGAYFRNFAVYLLSANKIGMVNSFFP